MTNKPKVKPSITDRRVRFEKARAEFEYNITQKVATAFYTLATTELLEKHHWSLDEISAFLRGVTDNVTVILTLTAAHGVALEMDEEMGARTI